MKNFFILLPLAFFVLTGASCDKKKELLPADSAGLANPASVYCTGHGGNLEMRDNESGQYGVCIFSDGSECEEWSYFRGECSAQNKNEENSEEMQKSRKIARSWIENNSSTYLFDGLDLRYLESQKLDCPDCYEHLFFFKSNQAGFGDRRGEILAQVVTPHEIAVRVERRNIISAITDSNFDELAEKNLLPINEFKQIKVSLVPRNNSLESGTAVLKEELGKVKIIIDILNSRGGIQPASIQNGSCDDLGKVLYKLSSVKGGKSETLLNISLADFKKQFPLAINVYQDISSSAVCGEIIF